MNEENKYKYNHILLSEEEVSSLLEEKNFCVNPLAYPELLYPIFKNRLQIVKKSIKDEDIEYYKVYNNQDKEYLRFNYKEGTEVNGQLSVLRVYKPFFSKEGYSPVLDNYRRNIPKINNIVDVSTLPNSIKKLMDKNYSDVIERNYSLDFVNDWRGATLPYTWAVDIYEAGVEERPYTTVPAPFRKSCTSSGLTGKGIRGTSYFYETSTSFCDYPLFTFREEDIVVISGHLKGLYLWSIPKLLMKYPDPTMYRFAKNVFGGMKYWEYISSLKMIEPYVKHLSIEQEFEIKSEMFQKMYEIAEEGGAKAYSAINWLSKQGWKLNEEKQTIEKRGVGRPTKEIQGEVVEEDLKILLSDFNTRVNTE